MITLHNLQGLPIAINGALIERVSGGPETHVTLANGTSYIVKESLEEIVTLHREDRAVVQALASRVQVDEKDSSETSQGVAKDGLLRLVTRASNDDGGEQP